ncbi:MAG: hypothetical protein ABSA41_09195 [Terriglobia bacterium]|jgi:hypothetical protein
MAFSKSFERELNNLFRQRTDWLRRRLGTSRPGKPPEFGRKKVDTGILKLQAIASDALAHKLAKSEFNAHVASRKNYHVKGRGPDDKKAKFEEWFDARFGKTKGLIYAFWGDRRKCIYVGRTGSHGSRPSSHMEKFWFSGVKRVTIFAVRGKSHIPKLECLAIHYFQPTRNKNKAATKKWTKACPLCKTHKYIENELRDIFRFR